MNKSINLISTKNSFLEKEQRILAILRGIAISLLITVAIVSIGTFIIGATIPLTDLKQQENSTITSIASLHKKLATYQYSKDRIKNIQLAISSRKDLTEPINIIFPKLSHSSTLESISVDGGLISISVSSGSLDEVNRFINDMYDLSATSTIIKNIKLESLSLNAEKNIYSISMKGDVFGGPK